MNLKQLERAKVYAQGIVHLADFKVRGSREDARLLLAAIIELEAMYTFPHAVPNSTPQPRKKAKAA